MKSSNPIILDTKWTNYSQKFLDQKFSMPENQNQVETEDFYKKHTSYQNIVFEPLPDISTFYHIEYYTSSSCFSPRDGYEVSLLESEEWKVRCNFYSMQEKSLEEENIR